MLLRYSKPNELEAITKPLDKKRDAFFKEVECTEIKSFPFLTMRDLRIVTCGSYQLKMAAKSYIPEHLQRHNGSFIIEVPRNGRPEGLIRAAVLHPRHIGASSYKTYVQYDPNKVGPSAIIGWRCLCKTGLRTAGCCSHIASILLEMGFYMHGGELDSGDMCKNVDDDDEPSGDEIVVEVDVEPLLEDV